MQKRRDDAMDARAMIHFNGDAEVSGFSGAIPWWSFTKTALAVALLKLSERGRIDLDNNVAGERFTPAQLLRHEAGLPDYGALPTYHADVEAGRPPWPVEDVLAATQADRLLYEPGQGWAYSNIGYWLVSKLIEQASDRPLPEALDELVFSPAELSTARLAATPADLALVAMGEATAYHPGWVYHGLVVGTAADAGRLLHRLLKGTLVEARTFSRMVEGRPLPQFRSARYPDPAYGLGLMCRATDTIRHPIGHTGSGPGSEIAVYGQGSVSVVWSPCPDSVDTVSEALSLLKQHEENNGA